MDSALRTRLAGMPQTPDAASGWTQAEPQTVNQRLANSYLCGEKASRNVCLILVLRKWPHHRVPFILNLPRWF
jgi:hypothetical protein